MVRHRTQHLAMSLNVDRITNSPIADVFVVWAKDDNNDIR